MWIYTDVDRYTVHNSRYTQMWIYTILCIHKCRYTQMQMYTIVDIHKCGYTQM